MSSASDASSGESSSLAGDQPEETWQDWEEDESEGFKSLFDGTRFPSLEEVLAHDAEAHSFNLRQYRTQVGGAEAGQASVVSPPLLPLPSSAAACH